MEITPLCQCMTASYFVGLALYQETAEYLYIEHFYILQALQEPSLWATDVGSAGGMRQDFDFEIDPSMDAIVCRRKMFL